MTEKGRGSVKKKSYCLKRADRIKGHADKALINTMHKRDNAEKKSGLSKTEHFHDYEKRLRHLNAVKHWTAVKERTFLSQTSLKDIVK